MSVAETSRRNRRISLAALPQTPAVARGALALSRYAGAEAGRLASIQTKSTRRSARRPQPRARRIRSLPLLADAVHPTAGEYVFCPSKSNPSPRQRRDQQHPTSTPNHLNNPDEQFCPCDPEPSTATNVGAITTRGGYLRPSYPRSNVGDRNHRPETGRTDDRPRIGPELQSP